MLGLIICALISAASLALLGHLCRPVRHVDLTRHGMAAPDRWRDAYDRVPIESRLPPASTDIRTLTPAEVAARSARTSTTTTTGGTA